MTLFNTDNTEWASAHHPLFLGQAPALHDSINVTYPKIFELYKRQKSIDWAEDEISLEASRMDMLTCPKEIKDIMIKNLALQWELDSVASRAMAPVFAPFVTNPELWLAISKNGEIEGLHTLTYSEIVRQCIPDPNEIFKEVMNNKAMEARMSTVLKHLNRLSRAGAELQLGLITKEEAYPIVMMGWTAVYLFERLQFMASFSATFAVVNEGWFAGIGKLVQKIMIDERLCHAELGGVVLNIELATERGAVWLVRNKQEIKQMIDEVVNSEKAWGKYMFSEGRKIVGYNEKLFQDYVEYESYPVYDLFGFNVTKRVTEQPLKYMDNYLDMNKFQNANQESEQANYLLNIIVDDIGDDPIE